MRSTTTTAIIIPENKDPGDKIKKIFSLRSIALIAEEQDPVPRITEELLLLEKTSCKALGLQIWEHM